MAEQFPRVRATGDAALAARLGLTRFDEATGQWRAPLPAPAEPQERPGEGVFFQPPETKPETEPETEGSEQPSPDGTASSTSSTSTETSDVLGKTPRRKPARTTESPS